MKIKLFLRLMVLIIGLFVGIPSVWSQNVSVREVEQLDFAQGLLSRGLFDMAIEEYRKFIDTYPQTVNLDEAYLSLGESFISLKDFPKAIEALIFIKEKLATSDKVPIAILRLGEIYVMQNKMDEAVKEFLMVKDGEGLSKEDIIIFYLYAAQANRATGNKEVALDYFQKAGTSNALQQAAEILTEQKNYTDAINTYSKAFESSSDESFKGYVVYKRAEVFFLVEEYLKAIEGFQEVLVKYSTMTVSRDAFTNLLLAHFNLAQYQELLVEYQKHINLCKEKDSCFDVYFITAKTYMELGKVNEAQQCLDKSSGIAELSPQRNRNVQLLKARILIYEHKYKNALELLEVQGNGQSKEELFLKAHIFTQLNEPQKSIDLLEQYLGQQGPVESAAHINYLLGNDYQMLSQEERALEYYSKVTQENAPVYFKALRNSALIHIHRRDIQNALIVFNKIINDSDENYLDMSNYVWMCNEYLKSGEFDDVLRVANYAGKFFDEQKVAEIAYFKAEAYRNLNDFMNAKKFYDIVLASSIKGKFLGGARIGNGLCLIVFKKYEEAKSEFINALDENPDDTLITLQARFELGNIAFNQKNLQEALRYYLLVASLYDEQDYCSRSLLKAAEILLDLKRSDEAVRIFQEILEKYEDSPAAGVAKERLAISP